jgi:hypothetical protein
MEKQHTAQPWRDRLIATSEEILQELLMFKKLNPNFTFSLRERDSPQSDEERLSKGQWFQGSGYIYVPLFKRGDRDRKIKTIGFVISFDEEGAINANFIEISFKRIGDDSQIDEKLHRELASRLNIQLNEYNNGKRYYDNPDDYINNLHLYLKEVYPLALELINKYKLADKYLVDQETFQKRLSRIGDIREGISQKRFESREAVEHFSESVKSPLPLNQILYGPPGTGKTYNTINKAIEIANPNFNISTKTRPEIKTEYNNLLKQGRINFTTFHQSLSYEDFIEGLKPQPPEKKGDNISYEVEDGVFKAFCNRARFTSGNFDEVIEKFKRDISVADGKLPLKITATGTTFDITYRGTNVFYVQPLNTTKEDPWYAVNIKNIRKAFESDSYEKIYNPTYVREVIGHLKKKYGLIKSKVQSSAEKENYVFIIDEINRGNVSQIFGELITLIEADKREDQPEALQIQLPYSKEVFSVPDNLYILGTMNTADRSVEALDTALRRRFSFEFMPPDSSKINTDGNEIFVDGISLRILLDTLNERIAYLLDEDHKIGHAYFCSIESDNKEQLEHVFKNKIIPLLREYFYNDHGKIRLVLGDAFIEKQNAKPTFPVKDVDELIVDKTSYRIKPIDKDFDIIAALKKTLGAQA